MKSIYKDDCNLFSLFKEFPTDVFDLISDMVIPPKNNMYASIKTVIKYDKYEKIPTTVKELTHDVEKTSDLKDDDVILVVLFLRKSCKPF